MKNTIERIRDYIIYLIQPETIILFGSVAHGKNNIYSDVDILIVSETTANKSNLAKQIQSFVNEFSLHVDVLIRSQKEVADACSSQYSFLKEVVKNGKEIYKK